ncbi:MgtC/SapB family protein [Colwellia sp. D2M02]|uniref:MgtC/SapB family protein n=1 Tax=Colwellia sp. D2M02 TaxID=2841562 RepID=UPI002091A34F|nr:MgtC/SapB family protein [Colwellia sp. D2M02]
MSAILTCIFCGSMIGLERQLRGKPVGIRTSTLVVLGTYIFVATATIVSTEVSDPSRIIGQVITGVGFLGAGVMLAKDGAVVGVTSAATIWILSAIGISISHGYYQTSIFFAALVVGILFGVDLLEEYSQLFTRGVHSKYKKWKTKPSRFIDTHPK